MTTCATCTQPITPSADTRAVVLTPNLGWCRPCWLAVVTRPIVTAVERRMGRNWPTRCRLSA